MLEQHKDTIKDTPNFDDFIHRVKMRSEAEVQMLYDGMKGTRKMLEELFNKCLLLLPEVAREFTDYKQKLLHLHEQLDDK